MKHIIGLNQRKQLLVLCWACATSRLMAQSNKTRQHILIVRWDSIQSISGTMHDMSPSLWWHPTFCPRQDTWMQMKHVTTRLLQSALRKPYYICTFLSSPPCLQPYVSYPHEKIPLGSSRHKIRKGKTQREIHRIEDLLCLENISKDDDDN